MTIQIAPSEDYDQTARTYRLILIFALRTSEGTFSDVMAHFIVINTLCFPSLIHVKLKPFGPSCSKHHSLKSSFMTNLLTVVAKVFSNEMIFFCCKHASSFYNAKPTHIFSAKLSNLKTMFLPYFKKEIFKSRYLTI